jgi:hypothetical protein
MSVANDLYLYKSDTLKSFVIPIISGLYNFKRGVVSRISFYLQASDSIAIVTDTSNFLPVGNSLMRLHSERLQRLMLSLTLYYEGLFSHNHYSICKLNSCLKIQRSFTYYVYHKYNMLSSKMGGRLDRLVDFSAFHLLNAVLIVYIT